MNTHAELSAKLLRDAAEFFASVGAQNPDMAEQLTQNAEVFRAVADLVETNPTGIFDPSSIAPEA